MTLLPYLKSVGPRPVAAGNLKGMVDCYRNLEPKRASPRSTRKTSGKSFADATKLSMETRFSPMRPGSRLASAACTAPACEHVKEMARLLPADQMLDTGLVDYALGAAPHTGAFVIVYEESPLKKVQLGHFKPCLAEHVRRDRRDRKRAALKSHTIVPRGAMASGNTNASADGFRSLGTGMCKRNTATTVFMATQEKQRMPSNFGNLAKVAFSCDIC
jgi:hypothetical protein